MATFGSFALIVALALAAYNLLAGIIALRWIATARQHEFPPERLADTARRAGIACFFAVTGAAFALVWSVFNNDFSIAYIVEHSKPRPARRIQNFPRCGAARKVRCSCGPGCWQRMALCCA